MKTRKLSRLFIFVICLCLIGGLLFLYMREIKLKQGVVILNESNVRKLSDGFGQDLSAYVNKESKLSVKDITEDDMNNAYLDDQLVMERCYSYSGMVPLQIKEKLPFGFSYILPNILLRADSNLLLSNPYGDCWEIKESSVKITYTFDIIRKPDSKDSNLEIGYWNNGTFITFTTDSNTDHYEERIWAFQGDNFYPRIRNIETDDVIIINGIITIVRDDTMKKMS